MVNTRLFDTDEALIEETLELLRKTLSMPGSLMLSGGSTPFAVYNRMAAAPCPVHPERHLFLSDERLVPCASPDSNQGNLKPMLQALRCADRFIGVPTAGAAEQAAAAFSAALQKLESIDLGFLGMGADGHTAGIFTAAQAAIQSGPLTLHTRRPDGMHGVSVTPALLHRIGRLILLVTGEAKRGIIRRLLDRPETLPAGIALADHPNVELWTDLAV